MTIVGYEIYYSFKEEFEKRIAQKKRIGLHELTNEEKQEAYKEFKKFIKFMVQFYFQNSGEI